MAFTLTFAFTKSSAMINLGAVILTKDEEANVGRCLEKLKLVPKVLVLDSGSRDGTEQIAKSFPNVEWATRPFDGFAGQCNYALSKLRSEWVLSMDADYILSDEVIREISDLRPGPEVCSYTARFVYCIDGKPLRRIAALLVPGMTPAATPFVVVHPETVE